MGNSKSYKRAIHSIILVFLWMLPLNVFLSAEKLLVDKIVENATPSIVQIHIYDEAGELWGRGSGFFIAPGKILTCHHVMEDAYSARIITSIRTYNRVKILKMERYADLALLMIIPGGEEDLEIENEQVPIRDQYIIAIGYDFKKNKNDVSYGIVHSVVSEDGYKDIVNSAPIVFGWSGGPLLNLNGKVIGVHKYYYGDEPGLYSGDEPGLAISTSNEAIREFLEGPYGSTDLAYAGSSELLTADLYKLGDFWGPVFDGFIRRYEFCVLFLENFIESHVFWGPFLKWISEAGVSTGKTIFAYLFAKGLSRGVFIIILVGILVGWRSPPLFKSVKSWKERKAINKIIKWRDGGGSLEKRTALKARNDKEEDQLCIDKRGRKLVLDKKKMDTRNELILKRYQIHSDRSEDFR
jgi:hypothetical protein